MFNYIRKYAGKFWENPAGRGATFLGGAFIALYLTLYSPTDHGQPMGGKAEQHSMQSESPRISGSEKHMVCAEEFARLAAEEDLNSPEGEADFLHMNGYVKEHCKKCEWLKSDEAMRLYMTAKRYGVEEVAYGLPGTESNYMQFDDDGNTIESPKGAVGKLQVLGKMGRTSDGKMKKKGGFDEVWHMFNDPLPHQRRFIEKYKKSMDEDARLLRGTREDVYNRILNDESANEANGFAYLGFLKEACEGDINMALEAYNAGRTGRRKFPNDARKYRESIFSRQEEWDMLLNETCPEMEMNRDGFYERLYTRHMSNYFRRLLY